MNIDDFSLQQGNDYLLINRGRTNTILKNTKKYNADDKYSLIEGFTEKTETPNKDDPEDVKDITDKFNKAVSNYGASHKQLMLEANDFINNRKSTSNIYNGKIIKMKNGRIGYVTDKNIFKYIGSENILKSLDKSCPSKVDDVDFSSENHLNVGGRLGTNPDFIVGKPMKENSLCVPTEINVQVQGQSFAERQSTQMGWLGCYNQAGDFFDKQDDLTGKYLPYNNTINRCAVRAVDVGASVFYIGHEPDNNYTCFTSKKGLTSEKIKSGMEPGIVKKISSVIHTATLPATSSISAAGIMNNGQIALGNIPSVKNNNFGLSVEKPIIWKVPGINKCSPIYGARIDIQSANYGANCNGKTANSNN